MKSIPTDSQGHLAMGSRCGLPAGTWYLPFACMQVSQESRPAEFFCLCHYMKPPIPLPNIISGVLWSIVAHHLVSLFYDPHPQHCIHWVYWGDAYYVPSWVHIIPLQFLKDRFVPTFSLTNWKNGSVVYPFWISSLKVSIWDIISWRSLPFAWDSNTVGPPPLDHLLVVHHSLLVLLPSLQLSHPFLGCVLLVHVILCKPLQSKLCKP